MKGLEGKANKRWYEETRKETESVSRRSPKKRTRDSSDDSPSEKSDFEEWIRELGFTDSDLYC